MAEPEKVLVWAVRMQTGAKHLLVLEKDKPKYRVPLSPVDNGLAALEAFGQRLANERGEKVTLVLMNDLAPGATSALKRHFDVPPGPGH